MHCCVVTCNLFFQAHIEVEHYLIFGWVRVPCLPIHLGSCTYPDICAWVPKKGTYEEDFSVEGKDTCRCPIHKVDINLQLFDEKLPVKCNFRVPVRCISYLLH